MTTSSDFMIASWKLQRRMKLQLVVESSRRINGRFSNEGAVELCRSLVCASLSMVEEAVIKKRHSAEQPSEEKRATTRDSFPKTVFYQSDTDGFQTLDRFLYLSSNHTVLHPFTPFESQSNGPN